MRVNGGMGQGKRIKRRRQELGEENSGCVGGLVGVGGGSENWKNFEDCKS